MMKKIKVSGDISTLSVNTADSLNYYLADLIKTSDAVISHNNPLSAYCLDTPLGAMLAIADNDVLYALDFVDKGNIDSAFAQHQHKLKAAIGFAETPITAYLAQELQQYFLGQLKSFTTPLFFLGTAFQKKVWHVVEKIPYGNTCSYVDVAVAIGRPTAFRAAAQANAACQYSIVVPCHRVIRASGDIGGFGSGSGYKQYLIDLEQAHCE